LRCVRSYCSGDGGTGSSSSGYAAGTCWSRDTCLSRDHDDVVADNDVRVSWSDSTANPRPTHAGLRERDAVSSRE